MSNTPATRGTGKGVLFSVVASSMFGFIYYYAILLHPLDGMEIYGWRILFTLPCLTVFMKGAGFWPLVAGLWERLLTCKRLIPLLCLSSFLLGVQVWLFMWAPVNGKALEVSLGYLLMPLVMVLCGRLIYKERLLPYQRIAVLCAACGVGNQLLVVGGISWEMLTVCIGMPLYFVLRRALKTDHLGGLWFDFLLMLPAGVFFLCSGGISPWEALMQRPLLLLLIPLLGLLSAISIALYVMASKFLPLGLFGLLSYLEPMLLVVVSLLLGERISPEERLTYIGVGLAVLTLMAGGTRSLQLAGKRAARH